MEEIMAKNLKRAKFIKRAREERAWTQTRLSEIAGVTLRTIQRLEKDGAANFETLMGVASAFEIDVKELNPTSGQKEAVVQRKVYLMPRLASGKSLADVVVGSEQFQFVHDEDHDPRSINAMKDILRLLQADVVRLYDANPIERLNVEEELSKELKGLEDWGYYLFGIKRIIPRLNSDEQVSMCMLFMSHARSLKIVRDKKANMLLPAVLTEVVK